MTAPIPPSGAAQTVKKLPTERTLKDAVLLTLKIALLHTLDVAQTIELQVTFDNFLHYYLMDNVY